MTSDQDTPIADPLVGQVIQERFRVEKKLGQGGMGAIYLAEHLLLKKKVAIKCLHAGLASNPDVVRRFKNEAVAATSIGHPNIVDVMDMGRFDDGTFFMVLEFLDGRDWQEDLDREGPQPVNKVAQIGVQICEALGAAAAKGIVHRDLKPENIFLIQRQGDSHFVKILDFGISKILHGSGGATKTGELMGTPYYMAPEQVLGEKEITHLADVYALGVILFQALTGKVPFEGDTLPQVILKIATQAPPSLEEQAPELPAELSRLIDQMMQKDPLARPQTFQEVASRLAAFLDDPSRFSPAFSPSASVGRGSGSSDPIRVTTQAVGTPDALGKTLPPPAPMAGARSGKVPPWVWVVGAAVVLILGAWLFGGSDEASQEADKEVTQSDEKEKATVRVEISTIPTGAHLLLDGKPLSNPFDGDLTDDGKSHELVVQLAGYKTEIRTMVLTAPQRIVVSLTKEAKAGDSASPQAASSGPKTASSPKTAASPKTASTAQPAPAPRPASGQSSDSTPKPLRRLEQDLKKLF